MEFVTKMMNRNNQDFAEEIPCVNPQTTSMEDDEALAVKVMRWKRLVMMMGVAQNHALTGSILSFLEQMRNQHAEDALQEYRRVAGTAAVRIHKKASSATTLTPMAKGKALKPSSKTKGKPYPKDPEMCPHPADKMSLPRGGPGGSAWMTCMECGSRWERVTCQEKSVSVMNRIPNPTIVDPAQALQEQKELAVEALIKDTYSKEFHHLHQIFLNYKASGMLSWNASSR